MNEINIKFKSILDNISICRNIVGMIILDKNPTMSFINELKTVVSEAFTNAVIHGYDNNENNIVEVNVLLTDEEISLDIIDFGKGISDVDQAMMPMFTTKEVDDRSGLGFTIMQLFCDDLKVLSKVDEGTTVKIKKSFI